MILKHVYCLWHYDLEQISFISEWPYKEEYYFFLSWSWSRKKYLDLDWEKTHQKIIIYFEAEEWL